MLLLPLPEERLPLKPRRGPPSSYSGSGGVARPCGSVLIFFCTAVTRLVVCRVTSSPLCFPILIRALNGGEGMEI